MEELQPIEANPRQGNKLKFIIGGIVIVAAIIYLMVSSLSVNVQYFLTVEELLNKQVAGELAGQNVRASGAVLGDSIQYNMDTLELRFTVVHVPGDNQLLEQEGGLALICFKMKPRQSSPARCLLPGYLKPMRFY